MNDLGQKDKLRRKYLTDGIDNMTDMEILQLLLSLACPDFESAAAKLLDEYGSIKCICDTEPRSLMKHAGLNDRSAVLLRMISEIGKKCFITDKRLTHLRSSSDAVRFFSELYIGCHRERLSAVCIDRKMKITAKSVIAEGSAASVKLSLREIVSFALGIDAECIIIAHNHPTGRAVPSAEDYASTELLFDTLSRLGITLLDHIIVGTDGAVSMRTMPSPLSIKEFSDFRYRIDGASSL